MPEFALPVPATNFPLLIPFVDTPEARNTDPLDPVLDLPEDTKT